MSEIDTKRLRERAERYAKDDVREDLDAQEWGEAMPPWDVLALLDEVDRLRALTINPGATLHGSTIQEIAEERDALRAQLAQCQAERDEARASQIRMRDDILRRHDQMVEIIEFETAKQIADWLAAEYGHSRFDTGGLFEVIDEIRSGAWRKGRP